MIRLKKIVREGDTVVVESWSRLARSTKDLIDLVDFFSEKNVKIVCDKERVDNSTPQGRLMITVFQGFSEFERELIVDRTKEGLKRARARGRPKVDSKKLHHA